MGLKEALLANKHRLDEITTNAKIQKMLQQQSDILQKNDVLKNIDKPCTNLESRVVIDKPSKKWNDEILKVGGVSYYHTTIDGKDKKLRVALSKGDCSTLLKFHCRVSDGSRFSVAGRTYTEAQKVVDDIFGKGMYKVSASVV